MQVSPAATGKMRFGGLRFIVNADRKHDKPIFPLVDTIGHFLIQLFQRRLAWAAPRGPEIKQHKFAEKIAQLVGCVII